MSRRLGQLWTISASLVLPVILMGLLAMALVLVTTDIYRENTLDDQKTAISELVQLESRVLLNENLALTTDLALSLNAEHFKKSLTSNDVTTAQNYLDSNFARYFVTAGIVKLERLYAYDGDLNLITSSTMSSPHISSDEMVCPELLEDARMRTGASRLASIDKLCAHKQRSYLSVIVPVGGLRPVGYVQAVTDPQHFLTLIEARLGFPIQIFLPDNSLVFQSESWPKTDSRITDHLISRTEIQNNAGKLFFTIETSRNMSDHFEQLRRTRNFILVVAVAFTVFMGVVALIFMRISTISPVRRLMQYAHSVNKENIQHDSQIKVTGAQEIMALARSFNDMTHRLSTLYQDLSASNASLTREVAERKVIEKKLQQAHDALAEKVDELNQQAAHLKQVNEQLVLAKEGAESANREKSQFLARMSHELRTPLNSILGYAQLMTMKQNNDTQEQADWAQHIYDSGQYLLSLVDEILDLASIEAGKIQFHIEPVEMIPLLQECVQITSQSAKQRNINTKLDVYRCGENLLIKADALRLKQVFLNLLSNAVKYNSEGGELKVSCDLLGQNRVRLCFSDTGPGIDEALQKQLFIPFNRLDADKQCIPGAGVGLAVTRQLTELMHGKIGVNSKPGKGSTFWVEFDCELSA